MTICVVINEIYLGEILVVYNIEMASLNKVLKADI